MKELNLLWNLLEQKANKYKVTKFQKEKSFREFLNKIENAKSSIYLFGLNFPKYMTNPNKIFTSLKKLEKNNPNVEVKIFIPNLKVKDKIKQMNIYPPKYNMDILRINLHKIQDFQDDFEYLNIKVIEYNKYINFGFSAIDIDINNSFIHISKVRKNEYIKDAEYFNIEKDKSISYLMGKIIKYMER
jgi:hypothetical protein